MKVNEGGKPSGDWYYSVTVYALVKGQLLFGTSYLWEIQTSFARPDFQLYLKTRLFI